MNKKLLGAGIGILVLVAGTAWAAAYFTQTAPQSQPHAKTPAQGHPRVVAVADQPPCDDSNVLGYVAGGAAGGILGNQVGKGSGNTAATIAGTLGGAYLGGQYIPLKNVTCRQ